jgi:hypothetical protein
MNLGLSGKPRRDSGLGNTAFKLQGINRRCYTPLVPNRISSALLRRGLVEVPLTKLMFECPRTKKLVPTSVDIDLADIDKLPPRFLNAPMPHGARMDTKGYLGFRRHAGTAPVSIATCSKPQCPAASRRPGRSRKPPPASSCATAARRED